MNFKKPYTSKNIVIAIIIILIVALFCLYQFYTLKIAHSSFENYYKFRGCVELVEKTDTYGVCKLSSGETIKLVKVNDRWFLDGDLGW